MAPVAGLRVALCQTAQLAARVRAVIRPCQRRIDGSLVLQIELQLLAGRRQRQQAKQRCCKFLHGSSLRRKRRWISKEQEACLGGGAVLAPSPRSTRCALMDISSRRMERS